MVDERSYDRRERGPSPRITSLNKEAIRGSRIGVLKVLWRGPEDREVGDVVRRAIDDMRTQGAATVDVAVPNLPAQLAASNLLTQELKFDLGSYLKNSSGAAAKSVDELLASGLHAAQLQGILDVANAQPDGYLNSDDYQRRLAARVSMGQAILKMMDDNRLDAIVYPTTRRIAPLVGGNQIGSNAGLSAQTGFPAIAVPAGFTPGGFPVGIELLGRPFAEPTPITLAFTSRPRTTAARRRTCRDTRKRTAPAVAYPRFVTGCSFRSDGDRYPGRAAVGCPLWHRCAFQVQRADAPPWVRSRAFCRVSRASRRRVSAPPNQPAEWRCGPHSGEIIQVAGLRRRHTARIRSGRPEGGQVLHRGRQQGEPSSERPRQYR